MCGSVPQINTPLGRLSFFAALLSRPLPTAALPSSPIVGLLTPGEATQRTNCPQMACRNGRPVSTDCSTALISSRAELKEQRDKTNEHCVSGRRVDSNVTPCLVHTGSPLHLFFVCFVRRRLKEGAHTQENGAAVSG